LKRVVGGLHFPGSGLNHAGEKKFREGVGVDPTRIVGRGDEQTLARIRNGLHVGMVKN
jgi:hypothetical protein